MRIATRNAGTTLAELLAVVALAGVLAGLSVPRLVSLAGHVRLAEATAALADTLRLARAEALARHATLDVATAPGARGWVVRELPSGPSLHRGALPAGVRVVAAPRRGRVRFDPLGGAENASVVLATMGARRTVVVSQRGRVRTR